LRGGGAEALRMTDAPPIAFVEGADLPDIDAVRRDPALGGSGRALVDAVLARDAAAAQALLVEDGGLATTHAGGASLAELAVATGDVELLERLLEAGVPADPDGDGNPLILALHAAAPDPAFVLLRGGAAPTPTDAPLEPLRAAIALGSAGGVRLLLDHGADANTLGPLGRRPLHIALDMEQFAIAELLLERGADPWALDASGANLATAAATPMLSGSPENAAAQGRLRERVRGLGWPDPEPTPAELVRRAAAGTWPPRT
jgi:hypothetical protein